MNIILLSRLDQVEVPCWNRVSNPSKSELKEAEKFLSNSANEYLQRKNSGVIYRYIRAEDVKKYDLGGYDG